jgi:DnaJ-class molecular chaperone
MPNYYEILQVSPEAELDVIRSAYHRLAHKYHPDHNPSPEALRKMREINAAYEVLANQE